MGIIEPFVDVVYLSRAEGLAEVADACFPLFGDVSEFLSHGNTLLGLAESASWRSVSDSAGSGLGLILRLIAAGTHNRNGDPRPVPLGASA